MAWGYFDHPPMVALLVELSSVFFEGELGVRFVSCLLSAGTAIVLWHTVDKAEKQKYIPHFFVLLFSMTLVNAYGFFTLPDTPLLFFTALFLLVYKKFLEKPAWALGVILGMVMAALMYSKYHAVLVILFVLLSNLKLVFNRYAWIAVIIALLCYIPHLLWLAEYDFVSIKYHLFERPNQPYEFFEFTGGFLLSLIALFGLTFPFIYQALFRTKTTDLFTKALAYLVYGVIVFFFVSSFQRRVQTQWVIVICIPLAILAYRYMLVNSVNRKWVWRLGLVNIAILLFLRLGLVFQALFPISFETHGNKKWVNELASQVGDTPVVFENSYRMAPMYSFYSRNPSFSLNNVRYRKNQYSIDGSEASMQNKKVLLISKYSKKGEVGFKSDKGTQYLGNFQDDFESFRKLQCIISEKSVSKGDRISLDVFNPYQKDIPLKKLRFGIAYLNAYKRVAEIVEVKPELKKPTTALKAKDTLSYWLVLPQVKADQDLNYFKVCISENGLYYGLNGESIKLE